MSKIKIYMGVPSTGTRVDAQCYALREIAERYKDQVELIYPEHCAFRFFHDYSRCEIVDEFLASDCDVLWFLDSDVVPPKHILDLITSHYDKWECAGAAYPIFMPIPGSSGEDAVVQFTAYSGLAGQGIRLSEIPPKGTAFIDGLATGCLFIKRGVFAKLEKPYFEFKYDKESRKMTEGEDLGFCLKASKLGIKFFTDFSMLCAHYKNVNLLQVNNYAIDHSNNRIKSYDSEIRPQIEASIKAVREAAFKKGFEEGKKAAFKQPISPNGIILPSAYK